MKNVYFFKNWAVVGDVLNVAKPAFQVAQKLENMGYSVSRVSRKPPYGQGVYPSLLEIPHKIDVLDLIIAPSVGVKVVQDAHQKGIKYIFIQPGAESQEILDTCAKNGMQVVQDCVLVSLNAPYHPTTSQL